MAAAGAGAGAAAPAAAHAVAVVQPAAAAAALAALQGAGDEAADRLVALEAQAKDLRVQNKANKKAMKNELAKKQRLTAKASKLTTAELLQVVAVRTAAVAKAKAKAAAGPPAAGPH